MQIVATFAIGLSVDPMNSFQRIFNRPRFKLDDAATIYVTVAGYILINALFVLSHMLGDRVPKRTVMFLRYIVNQISMKINLKFLSFLATSCVFNFSTRKRDMRSCTFTCPCSRRV